MNGCAEATLKGIDRMLVEACSINCSAHIEEMKSMLDFVVALVLRWGLKKSLCSPTAVSTCRVQLSVPAVGVPLTESLNWNIWRAVRCQRRQKAWEII
eukprot:750829-Hanusia_phi.AAC.2